MIRLCVCTFLTELGNLREEIADFSKVTLQSSQEIKGISSPALLFLESSLVMPYTSFSLTAFKFSVFSLLKHYLIFVIPRFDLNLNITLSI